MYRLFCREKSGMPSGDQQFRCRNAVAHCPRESINEEENHMKFFHWKKRRGSVKGAAAVLSVCMCLGLMAASSHMTYAEEGDGNGADGSAMGRYVEQTLETPDIWIYDIAAMPDGRLRLIGQTKKEGGSGSYEMWDSVDGGESWEKAAALPEEMNDKYFLNISLDQDGGGAGVVFCSSKDGQDFVHEYYSFDAKGETAQIPESADIDEIQMFCFGSQGELIGQGLGNSAFRMNRESGEAEQTFAGPGDYTIMIGVCGQELLMLGDSEVQRYDIATGEPLPYDESLNAQLFENGTDYRVTTTSSVHIVFGYTDDGRMYYVSAEGIFAHVQGGTVVEQLVSGGMCSLSEPGTGLIGMAVMGEDFYVVCQKGEKTKLLKYGYSPDTPTVPEKEVRVYSLKENEEIRQAIVMYQNAHPDTQISYETGLSDDGGVTAADALRTLNTDIMAGSGPDILVLDGMPVNSYIEKGILADISGIRDAVQETADPFEAMVSAWEKDGAVYAMPIRFKMPLLVGDSEMVGQAGDLTRLADLIASDTESAGSGVIYPFNALLSDVYLYHVCAGAWRNEDGTINEEKLLEYMVQTKKIRDSQMLLIDEQIIGISEELAAEQGSRMPDNLGVDGLDFLEGFKLSFGEAYSIHEVNWISSVNRMTGNITFAPLSGQRSNVFVPYGILGVSSMAADPESARSFVEFLFTDEAQTQSLGGGFPVSRNAFSAMLHEKEPGALGDLSTGTEDPETGERIIVDEYWMTQEEMDQLEKAVENLDTAADTDTVLMDAVLSQSGKCLNGECSPEEAVSAVMQTMNLYLAEG